MDSGNGSINCAHSVKPLRDEHRVGVYLMVWVQGLGGSVLGFMEVSLLYTPGERVASRLAADSNGQSVNGSIT